MRLQAGIALGALSGAHGVAVYADFARDTILSGIRDNQERDEAAVDKEQVARLAGKLATEGSAEKVFHDTAGWKTLESSCAALLEIIKALTSQFIPCINQELLDVVFGSLTHSNRFVREMSFYVCGEFASIIHKDKDLADADFLVSFDAQMCKALAVGLGDNWSQVRMASSVATRQFMMTLEQDARAQFFDVLLPRMVLNRYYVAEGVRLYSQATWAQVGGENGKEYVEQHIAAVVEYYAVQADADNHAVREAACACIAELGQKIDVEVIKPHFEKLLNVLVTAFQDESWPVRDAACTACGRFIKALPDEARSRLPELYRLFFFHVADNIWSVRENAANALGCVVDAFGTEALDVVLPWLTERIPSAKSQLGAKGSTRFQTIANETTFGVSKTRNPDEECQVIVENSGGSSSVRRIQFKFGDQDPMHSNQQLFSCGSLAPKLKRKGGGCMDCDFSRPQEPWETTDGCVYLLREISEKFPEQVCALLPTLADVLRFTEYPDHVYLLETTWKTLPLIAQRVGKKNFKKSFQEFLRPLHYSLKCNNQLARASAELFTHAMAKFLGPSILRGRIEQEDSMMVDDFERVLQTPFVYN